MCSHLTAKLRGEPLAASPLERVVRRLLTTKRRSTSADMSTKSSIKWKEPTADGPGYHLYEDVLDFEDDPPVYLRLDGVQVELETCDGGASITLALPRAIARELGLLTPNAEVSGERSESAGLPG